MKRQLLIFAIAVGPLSSSALSYKFNPEKSLVVFTAKGKPALISIKGEGRGLIGTLNESGDEISGQLQFPLDKLDTGIGMRNEHLRDKYLDIKKFPTANLKFTQFKKPADTSKSFPFNGELTLKGVSKPVSGTASIKQDGKISTIEADFTLLLTDYPLGVPSYKGITVAEKVSVHVTAEASKE